MLGTDEVRVFLAEPGIVAAPARRAAALAVLAADERARLATFVFERDRQIALASRVLQRWALSQCAAVPPDAWRFAANAEGRPEVTAPPGHDVRFSVSNTRGLVACAVTRARDLGVDVEEIRAAVPEDVAARVFTAEERATLTATPAPERPARFADLWTLKESYVKARGVGMAIALERVWFELDTETPRLRLDAALGDDPTKWELVAWRPTPRHAAALCVERSPAGASRITMHWVTDTMLAL